jgi:hypothetical protein
VQTRSAINLQSSAKMQARYGTAALSQISRETEQRPLIAAVALGGGILIGIAALNRS